MVRHLILGSLWSFLLIACGEPAASTSVLVENTPVTLVPTSAPTATPEPPVPTSTPTTTPSITPTMAPTNTPTAAATNTPTAVSVSTPEPTPVVSFAITEPTDAITVNTPTLEITGIGIPGMEFVQDRSFAQDQKAVVGENGTWSMTVDLKPGPNELKFRETATGIEAIVHVTYEEPPTPTPTPTPIPPTNTPVSTSTPVPTATPKSTKPSLYPVLAVVDGDTIRIRRNGKVRTLELIGLDAPEIKPAQCFGPQASARARKLLEGRKVRIVSDRSQDKRVYVWIDGKVFYNKLMIQQGYGREYTTQGETYGRQKEFRATESSAKQQKNGLWSPKTCNGKVVIPAATPTPTPVPPTATPRPPTPTPTPDNGSPDVYYENCDAVRAAGADPIRRGDPGYSSDLDRDGDGVACE